MFLEQSSGLKRRRSFSLFFCGPLPLREIRNFVGDSMHIKVQIEGLRSRLDRDKAVSSSPILCRLSEVREVRIEDATDPDDL